MPSQHLGKQPFALKAKGPQHSKKSLRQRAYCPRIAPATRRGGQHHGRHAQQATRPLPTAPWQQTCPHNIRKPYPHLSGFRGQPAVIQHRCGEPGCNEGLGWLELHDGVPKNSGPGMCREHNVLRPIERREHRSNVTSFIAATCTFGFIAWIIGMVAIAAITGESWGTPHAILTTTIMVAIGGAVAAIGKFYKLSEPTEH